jgi:hypothetical protein
VPDISVLRRRDLGVELISPTPQRGLFALAVFVERAEGCFRSIEL